jgi:hypothetical protein
MQGFFDQIHATMLIYCKKFAGPESSLLLAQGSDERPGRKTLFS